MEILRQKNAISGQATRRRPEFPPYRCFLSDLAGFEGFRRAGPTRMRSSIPHEGWNVNVDENYLHTCIFVSIQSIFISEYTIGKVLLHFLEVCGILMTLMEWI
jgi:hypothetical protein